MKVSDLNEAFNILAISKLSEEQKAHPEWFIDRIFDSLTIDEIKSVIPERIENAKGGKDAFIDSFGSDAKIGDVNKATGIIEDVAQQGNTIKPPEDIRSQDAE